MKIPRHFFSTFPNFHFKNSNFPFSLRGTSLIQSDSPQLYLKDFFWFPIKQKKEKGEQREELQGQRKEESWPATALAEVESPA